MDASPDTLLSVTEAGRALGVSASTIWRMIRRGELATVRHQARRLVPRSTLRRQASRRAQDVPRLTRDHPIFRLVGAGRSGGVDPGALDKHAVLDR
jgi:excisionase family DNA binding protein